MPVKTLPLGGAKTCAWAGAAASAKSPAAIMRQRRIDRPSLYRLPAVKLEPTMRARSEGRGLIVAGCLPFAAGRVIARDGAHFVPPCPFRALTGLPCPLCGGTRAFAWVARGDAGFLHYNAFWVLVAGAVGVAGGVGLVAGRPFPRGPPP